MGSDAISRAGRVLATIAAICSALNSLGFRVDTGKSLDAAASKMKDYPPSGKNEYPEREYPVFKGTAV